MACRRATCSSAQAAVGDLSGEEQRTRYFGFFTAALSLGFVLGPLIGGFLGDPEGASWAGPATAFYTAGGLNLLTTLLFAWLFAETLSDDDRSDDEFAVGQSLSNARQAFADEERRPYYLVLLLYIAGYTFFTTFYSVVLEDDLEMSTVQIGWFFSAFGLALMAVQLGLVERVEQRVGPSRTLWLALFCAAGGTLIAALAQSAWMAYAALPLFALGAGLVDPLVMSLLSRSTDASSQGRIQGVRGSVDSLGRVGPPFLAGPLAAVGSAVWPVLAGAALMASGGVLALRLLGDADGDDSGQETSGDETG